MIDFLSSSESISGEKDEYCLIGVFSLHVTIINLIYSHENMLALIARDKRVIRSSIASVRLNLIGSDRKVMVDKIERLTDANFGWYFVADARRVVHTVARYRTRSEVSATVGAKCRPLGVGGRLGLRSSGVEEVTINHGRQ